MANDLTRLWCERHDHPKNMTCVAKTKDGKVCRQRVCHCETCPNCGHPGAAQQEK